MTERAALERTLAEARAARADLPRDTTAFRWVDGEVPDTTVDVFGDVAVLSLYRERAAAWERALSQALAAARPLRAVYLKRRPREARRAANEALGDVAPPEPTWGAPVPETVALELGVRFLVRPPNGLNVGLYLDARDARRWVRGHARGRSVLNLFAYTCGFSVAARLGGATRSLSVDASRKVLDWGEQNTALNGLPVDRKDFVRADALDWLRLLARRGERFGLVIADPPSTFTTLGRRFSAARDYPRLAEAAARVVEPGGTLLACCNLAAWTHADLEAQARRGLAAAGRKGRVAATLAAPALDFRRSSTLKALALVLD